YGSSRRSNLVSRYAGRPGGAPAGEVVRPEPAYQGRQRLELRPRPGDDYGVAERFGARTHVVTWP
uniref:hypothetical protein n=1 Tax=Nocardia abscessus TaxID=120957 RepID=UPI0024586705